MSSIRKSISRESRCKICRICSAPSLAFGCSTGIMTGAAFTFSNPYSRCNIVRQYARKENRKEAAETRLRFETILTSKEQDNNRVAIHLKQISSELSPVNRRSCVSIDANQKEINFQEIRFAKAIVVGIGP